MVSITTNCNLSRHTVVCRAAQENGARANGVSILTGTTNSRFSRICSSVIAYPNGTKFTVELASIKEKSHFKFQQDPLSCSRDMSQQNFLKFLHFFLFFLCHFAHFAKITITRVCVLRSCWCIGGLKANTSIDFWINLINIEGVISDFIHQSKSNFCQAYRVNRFEEQA